jgi:hypothetical protein
MLRNALPKCCIPLAVALNWVLRDCKKTSAKLSLFLALEIFALSSPICINFHHGVTLTMLVEAFGGRSNDQEDVMRNKVFGKGQKMMSLLVLALALPFVIHSSYYTKL